MPFRIWTYFVKDDEDDEDDEYKGEWIAEVHRFGSNTPTTGERVWWGAYKVKNKLEFEQKKNEAKAKAKEVEKAFKAEEAEEEREKG